MVWLTTALTVVVVAALVGSVAVVRRLHRPDRRWGELARARLVMGIPWGSLVVIGGVLAVYLFVQDGITDVSNPVTIPYRAYSYFGPLGMLTASFSHVGSSHLINNLVGAAVVAPIAEYAWGHYPDGRDAHDESSASWRSDPRVRALVIFPAAVVAVGLLTSLFALGPVIGFSGVVFAFAGFAIVHYPIVTIVATLGVQSALGTIVGALRNPIGTYVAQPSPPGPPSWATIAIQGHALGFFVGFVLGVVLLRRRNVRPDPFRIWIAILLFGFSKSLWAIYWFGGENTYYLFRGPGVAVVTVLALVVTLAVAPADRSIVPYRLERFVPRRGDDSAVGRPFELAGAARGEAAARADRIRELARGSSDSRESRPDRRRAAFLTVLVITAVLAGIAVPVNLLVVDDAAASESAIEVEGYTVEYAENVQSQLVSPVAVGPLEDAVALEASGVIVTNERHQVWIEAVTAQRLGFTGEETVDIGGPGWREPVHVERAGWEPVGNETVYQVWLEADDQERRLVHESNGSRADVRIDDRTVAVVPDGGEFALEVAESGALETAPIPAENASTEAGGLTFERDGETVYASTDGTAVAVASEETYE